MKALMKPLSLTNISRARLDERFRFATLEAQTSMLLQFGRAFLSTARSLLPHAAGSYDGSCHARDTPRSHRQPPTTADSHPATAQRRCEALRSFRYVVHDSWPIMARLNPLSFTPGPVVFFTSALYIALFAVLLTVHLRVPQYPSRVPDGLNLTEAWDDLTHITRDFHPYNSHSNDHVRDYLLARVKAILKSKALGKDQVEIIDDTIANVTFAEANTTVYFEGTNIIVAIRGSEDDEPFYSPQSSPPGQRRRNNGGVLVNAHYDSVSSGYGATDDGVGVVTVLQLLSYFTEPQNWPKRTIILLLNNGEEDSTLR